MKRRSRLLSRLACAVGASLLLPTPSTPGQDPPPTEEQKPWRLQSIVGEESWLRLSGQTRLRFEMITGQFRAAPRLDNSDQVGVQRTLLRADADLDPAGLTLEIIDSRQYGGGYGSALNNGSVDAVDFLQAYGEIDLGRLGSGTHRIRAGRETIDLGSRRLVARNRFRNTINAFSGADWEWKSESSTLRAFWTLPVRRLPFDLKGVLDNTIELDDELIDRQFYGGFFQHELGSDHVLEVYAYGLLENVDPSLHRQIVTPGARFLRKPARGRFDYEAEAAYQVGNSRQNPVGPELDHSAWFQHASVGYTFDAAWSPRLRVAFDFASGDNDPNDGDNTRFDTLYGARRFEFGPTGIYGAVARSNLLSPEFRVTVKPTPEIQGMLAWRGVWLASRKDFWVPALVRDPTGDSGRDVGQQLEARVRWDLVEDSLRLEVGGAVLIGGRFQRDAPTGQDTSTGYGYAQMAWSF